MNLRKPFITTILIVLLVIDFIFLSFFVSIKNISNKEYLSSVSKNFDIISYIKDRKYIIKSTENLEYPIDVYNYINIYNFHQLVDESIDNLLAGKKLIIDSTKLTNILTKSVSLYDLNNKSDSFSFVKDDIFRFSVEVSYRINNDGVVQIFKVALFLVNSFIYYIPFIIAIILSGLIIIYEKKEGILINGIIYIIYSFFLYYMNTHFISWMLKSGSFYSYFRNMSDFTLRLDNLYIICFIFSFVLLLIYSVLYLKRVIRNIRLSSYENWR